MKKAGLIVGLAIIVGLGYFLYLAVTAFYQAMLNSSSEVVASIIGAMATILAGTAAIIINQRHERERANDEAHRLRKVEIYQKFVETVAALVGGNNENLSIKPPSDEELTNYMFEFKSKILLWGSPEVILAYLNFEKVTSIKGNSLHAANKLYAAIRQDIGLSNKGLNRNELVKLYIQQEDHGHL